MNILAIDASGLTCSVAIASDKEIIGEYTLNYTRTHSVTLLPLIDKLIKETGFIVNEFDYVATAGGPGSFTGLRIGSATAKGLSFSCGTPIISVPTVDALAYNMWGSDGLICPIMDARRHQTYTGIYRFEDATDTSKKLKVIHEEYATEIDTLIEELSGYNEPITFLGDGVPVFRDYIDKNLENVHFYAPGNLCRQRASSVALLASEYAEEGRIQTAEEHRPIYLRETQAERERKANEGK